jgi:proteasome lid subunit RPN8/RPN11
VTRAAIEGTFELDGGLYADLVEHARSDVPYEVCGLLAGTGGKVTAHYRIPNAARSMTFYNMEPQALLRAMNEIDDRDWELLAIYHSHPHTEAFPSATDVELAFYPEATYLIISLQDPEQPVIRAFGIVDGRVSERVLSVDGEEAPVGNR